MSFFTENLEIVDNEHGTAGTTNQLHFQEYFNIKDVTFQNNMINI